MDNKAAIEGDEFIQKHLAIIKEKTLESHIQLKLQHLQRPPFDASVKYFLETGTVNGNFLLALKSLFDNIPKILWAASPSPVQGMDQEMYQEEIKESALHDKIAKWLTKQSEGMSIGEKYPYPDVVDLIFQYIKENK